MNQNKVSYNFGKKGWSIIGFEVILLFFMTGMTVDGLNIIVPQIAAFRGWSADVILSISTPASIIALFAVALWGAFIQKFGLKNVLVTTMFLASASTIWYGHASSIAQYAIALTLMVVFINAFAVICGFAVCANWFPTKKGIVMGLTTIGMNLASAIINLILNALTARFNIAWAITIMGIVIAVVAVLVIIFVKATPEEAGCYPDNNPEIAALIHKEEEMQKDVAGISYLGALKDVKVWVFGIAYGCFGLSTVGIMSQLVSYFQDARSMDLNTALYTVTAAAVIGMVGSWLWGVVDQKIGTKKTSVIFGIWYFIGILLLIMPAKPLMYIGIIMLGGAIGGNGNFAPSMASYVFGRKDFSICYSCMNTIVGVVRSCSFILLGVVRAMFNGYEIPYIIFAAISLIGSGLIAVVKVKGAVGSSLEEK